MLCYVHIELMYMYSRLCTIAEWLGMRGTLQGCGTQIFPECKREYFPHCGSTMVSCLVCTFLGKPIVLYLYGMLIEQAGMSRDERICTLMSHRLPHTLAT